VVAASAQTTQVSICPFSGLQLESRPQWTDIRICPDIIDTFKVLGGDILVTSPRGHARLEDVETAICKLQEFAAMAVAPGLPFIWIADYRELETIPLAARWQFVDLIRRLDQLHCLVFCGVSPLVRLSARLALRFRLVDIQVEFADDYGEAVRLALQAREALAPAREVAGTVPAVAEPGVVTTRDEGWRCEDDGFAIRFEVVDGDVLHAVARGRLEEQHVASMMDLQTEVFEASGLVDGAYFTMVGLEGLEGLGYKARTAYLRRAVDYWSKHPFRLMVFYGANPVLNAAIRVTRPFAPFDAIQARDLEEARAVIQEARSGAGRSRWSPLRAFCRWRARARARQMRRYVEELTEVLGGVSWEVEGPLDLGEIEDSHPFRPVFEATALIKAELDELLEDRERAAEERQELQQQLARRKKMEALGLLAGGVAHDLNNILSGIVTFPEVLLLDESLSAEAREDLETIRESGVRAAAIVNDLMTITRGVVGQRSPLDLNRVVERHLATPEFRRLTEYHPGIRISQRLAAEPLAVLGSPVHLQKAVMNLVSNATEASSDASVDGQVTISTWRRSLDQPHAGYEQIPAGDYAVLRVEDDGGGIAPGDLDRIFEPFFTKKVMGRSGTGLGLTVVWNTVRDHDGYIDVRTSEGGTAIDLYLPLTEVSVMENEAATVTIDELRGDGEEILVVDDVESQRILASKLLTTLGYRVHTVASGEEAVAFLWERSVDLVLLDMIMDPGLNGCETYERIVELHPGQKAVISSGYSETDDVARARQLGAGAFVAKPYTLEGIGTAIRAELERDR
jgi:signal transduction histidine kinase/ActR/RegA family two-component response regulator